MTKAKVRKTFAQKRPERPLKEVIAEAKSERKNKSINKQFTAVQKAEGEGSTGTGATAGIFVPSDEQLEKINQFTQTPKTAEDVICFSTLSCNDQIDRDLDRFTTECVNEFAKLPDPFSPVGKGFMVSHDYTKLPVGTVFDADTKTIDGVRHLTNDVFMPNTEQYKNFIENLDFGIYRFVSVGVMLGESACSVCASPMFESRFFGNFCWCADAGHEKGLYYDPNSDEEDDWGWALPVEEGTKGAVLCTRDLFSPTDFYELSQVFLGAQYGAQLARGAATKGIIKAASAMKAPLLGLSRKEAEALDIPHINQKVREAFDKGLQIISRDASSIEWVDEDNIIWTFNAEEDEVLSLGEYKDSDTSDTDDDVETDDEEGGDDDGEQGRQGLEDDDEDSSGSDDEIGVEASQRSADADEPEGDDGEADADEEGLDEEDEDESDDEGEEDDEDVDNKSVVAAVVKAKLPHEVIEAVSGAKGGNALGVLLSSVGKALESRDQQIKELEPNAKLGEKFIKSKRAEALKWFIRNRQAGEEKGVKTDKFERMLDKVGDDIELLDEIIDEQKQAAQAKFPASARRSTVPTDPHNVDDLQQPTLDKESAEKVRKAHG